MYASTRGFPVSTKAAWPSRNPMHIPCAPWLVDAVGQLLFGFGGSIPSRTIIFRDAFLLELACVFPQHSRTRNAMVGAWANRGLEIAEVYRTAVRTAVRVRWRRWRRPRMQQIQAIVSVRPIAIEVYVLLVVGGVHQHRHGDLANVGTALHAIGAFLRFLERGQEDGDQDRDDADDNEQLDKSKCATPHKMPPFYPVHPDVTKTKSSTSGRSRQRMRKDFAARGGGNKSAQKRNAGRWDHRVRFSAMGRESRRSLRQP